jgi:hypothetical protein
VTVQTNRGVYDDLAGVLAAVALAVFVLVVAIVAVAILRSLTSNRAHPAAKRPGSRPSTSCFWRRSPRRSSPRSRTGFTGDQLGKTEGMPAGGQSARRARHVGGPLAGAVAAGVWAAAEPGLGRVLRTPYSDVRLLGRLASRRYWLPVGLAWHPGEWRRLRRRVRARWRSRHSTRRWRRARGTRQPLPALPSDRRSPSRPRAGWWPSLISRRTFAYETAAHVIFGAVLGAVLPDRGGHR